MVTAAGRVFSEDLAEIGRHRWCDEAISAEVRPEIELFCIRSARELDRFYEAQGLSRDG